MPATWSEGQALLYLKAKKNVSLELTSDENFAINFNKKTAFETLTI